MLQQQEVPKAHQPTKDWKTLFGVLNQWETFVGMGHYLRMGVHFF